jgi:hypothetical protein
LGEASERRRVVRGAGERQEGTRDVKDDQEGTRDVKDDLEAALAAGYSEQVTLADRLYDCVARLEGAAHEEEMARSRHDAGRPLPRHFLSRREWETLDWFVMAMADRHGIHRVTDPKKRHALWEKYRKVLHENLESAVNAHVDYCGIQADEFDAAAKEPDVRAAFRMYVQAAVDNQRLRDLDDNSDFTGRVMEALEAAPFDQQAWLEAEFEIQIADDYTYGNALVMLYNQDDVVRLQAALAVNPHGGKD